MTSQNSEHESILLRCGLIANSDSTVYQPVGIRGVESFGLCLTPLLYSPKSSIREYHMMKVQAAVLTAAMFLSARQCFARDADDMPQPGPKVAGLRLRLVVETQHSQSGDEFAVRLDLINVTDAPIKVSADWPSHLKGDFREYMEGTASMRTCPDITLWGIQVMDIRQPAPQAEHTLAVGATLTVEWVTKGRRLKNRVIHPNSNRNPFFPSEGLYGVHAELLLNVETEAVDTKRDVSSDRDRHSGRRPVLLRSNEQLVPVGGSTRAPKTAIGVVQDVTDDLKPAQISVGTVDGIKPGDQFLARTGMSTFWEMTVTETHVGYSKVSVKLGPLGAGRVSTPRTHEMLKPGASAGLTPAGVKGMDWLWAHH
jgi:hypothetical protein